MRVPAQITTKAKLRYAFLNKPNFITERYQVDLYDLPEETKKLLLITEYIKQNQYEDKDYKLTVKRNTPCKVTINNHDFNGVIGNGTEAEVTIQTMRVSFKNNEMFVCSMKDIKITNLITNTTEEL